MHQIGLKVVMLVTVTSFISEQNRDNKGGESEHRKAMFCGWQGQMKLEMTISCTTSWKV
jgi:hypothetical protein